MADLLWRDGDLNVDDIGGREVRVALLSLEPGSRLWLSLDGDLVQFERLPESEAPRAYRAVGPTAPLWDDRVKLGRPAYIEEVEIVERPAHAGASGSGFYRRENTPDRDAA